MLGGGKYIQYVGCVVGKDRKGIREAVLESPKTRRP